MATPYYNTPSYGLPCMGFPFKNVHTYSKRYLGGTALTGKVRASTTIICKNDAEMRALHGFWRDECNYGLEPFIFSGPLFGIPVVSMDFIGIFVGSFEPTKDNDGIWTITLNIKILQPTAYIRDDAGDLVTDDAGDYIQTDAQDLHATTDNIISYITSKDIVL